MINVRKRKEATVTGCGKAATLRVGSDCSFILLCEGMPGDGEAVWQMTADQAIQLAHELVDEATKKQKNEEPWRTIRALHTSNR